MNRMLRIRVTWARIIGVLATVLIVGAICLVMRAMRVWNEAYAIWNVGDVVVYHLARTGEWPRSWEDLRIDFAEGFQDRDGSRLAYLQSLVDIDFYADPQRLKAYPGWQYPEPPPFRVIRAKSGNRAHFNEPNQMVWEYLNGIGRASTLPATTRPLSER